MRKTNTKTCVLLNVSAEVTHYEPGSYFSSIMCFSNVHINMTWSLLVFPFCSHSNISTNIPIETGSHLHVPLRMKPAHFGQPLDFHLAPPSGHISLCPVLWFLLKHPESSRPLIVLVVFLVFSWSCFVVELLCFFFVVTVGNKRKPAEISDENMNQYHRKVLKRRLSCR